MGPLPAQTSEHPPPAILFFLTEKWYQAMPIPTHNMNRFYDIKITACSIIVLNIPVIICLMVYICVEYECAYTYV